MTLSRPQTIEYSILYVEFAATMWEHWMVIFRKKRRICRPFYRRVLSVSRQILIDHANHWHAPPPMTLQPRLTTYATNQRGLQSPPRYAHITCRHLRNCNRCSHRRRPRLKPLVVTWLVFRRLPWLDALVRVLWWTLVGSGQRLLGSVSFSGRRRIRPISSSF
jgi:hypothetical protein